MRIATRAARDHKAQARIVMAAETLAERFGLDMSLVEGLRVQRGDPATRAMLQREAVADLLESVVNLTEPELHMDIDAEELLLPPEVVELLVSKGYTSRASLREASVEELQRLRGIGEKTARRIKEAVA